MNDKPGPHENRAGFSRRNFFGSLAAGATELAVIDAAVTSSAQAGVATPEGQTVKITLTVNGQPQTVTVEPRWTLLQVLREHMGFTGTNRAANAANAAPARS